MKQFIVIASFVALATLGAGCGKGNKIDPGQPVVNTTNNSSVTKKQSQSTVIADAGVTVHYPSEYTMTKNEETNRRGSFLSYDFKTTNSTYPRLAEIQFFSESSIEQFNEGCENQETACFEGDYPTAERYIAQQQAVEQKTNYQNYVLQFYNNQPFLVTNVPCNGDTCTIREYTSFYNSTKIDVWILMSDPSQIPIADQLFQQTKLVSLL